MREIQNADIGNVGIKGSITLEENVYTLVASGRDVWDREDGAHFAYYELEGDFDVSVRIQSLSMPNLYTKAGIMARESLDPDSKNIYLVAFGDNGPRRNNDGGCEFQYRDVKGDDSYAIYPQKTGGSEPLYPAKYPNVWLRLNRSGHEFKAYFSNGEEWLEYGRQELSLNAKLLVGVCVTSHNKEQTCKCCFSNFEVI